MEEIKQQLPGHNVFYIENTAGFQLSRIPVGGEAYIRRNSRSTFTTSVKAVVTVLTFLRSMPDIGIEFGGPIAWELKLQTTVAASSIEKEYVAAFNAGSN